MEMFNIFKHLLLDKKSFNLKINMQKRIAHVNKLNDRMRSNTARQKLEARSRPDGTELVNLLDLSRTSLCQDRRDKVYGILGLATNVKEGDIQIDYRINLFQLFCNVIYFGISKSSTRPQKEAKQIIKLGQIFQSSLLGPEFSQSTFREMEDGRRDSYSMETFGVPSIEL